MTSAFRRVFRKQQFPQSCVSGGAKRLTANGVAEGRYRCGPVAFLLEASAKIEVGFQITRLPCDGFAKQDHGAGAVVALMANRAQVEACPTVFGIKLNGKLQRLLRRGGLPRLHLGPAEQRPTPGGFGIIANEFFKAAEGLGVALLVKQFRSLLNAD